MVSTVDRQKSLCWPTDQSVEPLKVCRYPSSLGPSCKCPRACVFDWWSSGRSRSYEGVRLVLSGRSCRCSSHPPRMAGAQRSPRAAWSSRSVRICRMDTRTLDLDLQTHSIPNQWINNENNFIFGAPEIQNNLTEKKLQLERWLVCLWHLWACWHQCCPTSPGWHRSRSTLATMVTFDALARRWQSKYWQLLKQ